MQFYKQLLWSDVFHRKDGRDSICPKILYSHLAEKALMGSPEMYNEIGVFDASRLPLMEDMNLLLPDIHPLNIAKKLNLSRQNIYDSTRMLYDAGLITNGEIYIIPDLFTRGYIPLLTETQLRATDLLLYSYLIYRKGESCRKAGATLTQIDVFREKLSAELNMNFHTISKSLARLEKGGWIKRIASYHNGFVKWWIGFSGCRQV